MELYIDDVVVKSIDINQHLADLEPALQKLRFHGLKMNLDKFSFGVSVVDFVGFLVHQKGLKLIKTRQ